MSKSPASPCTVASAIRSVPYISLLCKTYASGCRAFTLESYKSPTSIVHASIGIGAIRNMRPESYPPAPNLQAI